MLVGAEKSIQIIRLGVVITTTHPFNQFKILVHRLFDQLVGHV